MIEGIKDNVSGEVNSNSPEGNCVIIEYRNNENCMLAHLKYYLILVKEGEIVFLDEPTF